MRAGSPVLPPPSAGTGCFAGPYVAKSQLVRAIPSDSQPAALAAARPPLARLPARLPSLRAVPAGRAPARTRARASALPPAGPRVCHPNALRRVRAAFAARLRIPAYRPQAAGRARRLPAARRTRRSRAPAARASRPRRALTSFPRPGDPSGATSS